MADEKRSELFWQGRRVFITGHTGFIGSWLSHWLVNLGADVAGYALAPHTSPALYDVLGLDARMTSTIADIADRDALAAAIQSHQPEIIIHLAAQAIVGRAHSDIYDTWRVNVLGTVALLEAAKHCASAKAVCIFTTDKVYDNHENGHAHHEGDVIGGFGSYDCSKASAELAVRAFIAGNDPMKMIATIRAGNVIGGGDWSEARLVPDCARAFAQGKPVSLRHPNSVRPWQHVLDVCDATLRIAENLYHNPTDFSGAWNIGPDVQTDNSAAMIATQLAVHWQQTPAWQTITAHATFPEATTLLLDASKLAHALNWKPRLPLAEALSWSARWYIEWSNNPENARRITDAQVDAFLKA